MRTRRWRSSRRVRRKTQWYAGANSLCGARLSVEPCDSEVSPLPDLFTLLENPAEATAGLVGSGGDDVTVLRVVGDLWLWSSVSAAAATEPQLQNVIFYAGVYIGDDTQRDGIVLLDPTNSGDCSSKDWMWRGLTMHTYAAGTGATNQAQSSQFSSGERHPHLDIRVKRKLRKEEDIILAITCVTDNPFPAGTNRLLTTAFLYADIRVLAAMS